MSRCRSTKFDEVFLPDFRENILEYLEEVLLCGIIMKKVTVYPPSARERRTPPSGKIQP